MMIVIAPRCGGKTDRMVEWLRGSPSRILVVSNLSQADAVREEHPDVAARVMPWQTYWSQRPQHTVGGVSISEVGIDDADVILQRLCWQPMGAVSLRRPP